ncbi:hypothetical protein KAM336_44050 [Aeromonas caviae]|nr:hypothetical protein KAM336_44050 [Aeromonas caviae]GJA30246.1 hypothetical protein KAM340_44130 [Aeromonas caviae]GJA88051.1 hypothetical protein KAM356_41100 [Aeromonas caviae]GJA92167.1 hypothetical protein KAM357_41150 [Aeromonas caviae]GJB09439.1 hypothetical protein KAM361_41120 [Aeromonas caviae]
MTGALIIDTDGMKVSFDENTCRVNIFVIKPNTLSLVLDYLIV